MPASVDDTVATRLANVRRSMAEAAIREHRDPSSITLVAVSKTFTADEITPALVAGQRVFGENRVQEAKGKWPALRERFPDIELHLIGPLQTNKAREAVALFEVIHTIDRPRIAEVIAAEMARPGARQPRLLVQVNTGEETQKAGIAPAEAAEFVAWCRAALHLAIVGLMCIPPVEEEPSVHFAFLAELGREIEVPWLSMGMSADYAAAIAQGATHVRVGSAIFGRRG